MSVCFGDLLEVIGVVGVVLVVIVVVGVFVVVAVVWSLLDIFTIDVAGNIKTRVS